MSVLQLFVLATMEIAYCLPLKSLGAYGLKFMIKDDSKRGMAEEIQQGNFVHQDGYTQITKEQSGMMRI